MSRCHIVTTMCGDLLVTGVVGLCCIRDDHVCVPRSERIAHEQHQTVAGVLQCKLSLLSFIKEG